MRRCRISRRSSPRRSSASPSDWVGRRSAGRDDRLPRRRNVDVRGRNRGLGLRDRRLLREWLATRLRLFVRSVRVVGSVLNRVSPRQVQTPASPASCTDDADDERACPDADPCYRPATFQEASARVAELVDALDLGSSVARRGGSTPSARTIFGRRQAGACRGRKSQARP
jgi:hypothetical protein